MAWIKKGQKIEIKEVKKGEPKLVLPEEVEENYKYIKKLEQENAELKKQLEGMKSEKLRALGYIIRKAFREKLGEMK